MRTLVAAIALTALVTTVAFAQSVVHSAKAGKVKAGKVPVTVTLEIPAGYHIYGPKAGSTGIATSIKVKGTDYKISTINFPKPQVITLAGEKFEVYETKVSVPMTIMSTKKVKGKQKIHLLVTSQACNDRTCMPQTTVDVPVNVTF